LRVDFQFVYPNDVIDDVRSKLIDLLKETFEEMYIEKPAEDIVSFIEVKYIHKNSKYFIVGFSLFAAEEDKTTEIINSFGRKLQDSNSVTLVSKFLDENMYEKYRQYSKEIFEMESKLREIITFIFLDNYKDQNYNLLKEINVNIKKLNSSSFPDEPYFRSHFENEFFFLLFSDYIKLDELKEIRQPELTKAILDSEDFDAFKKRIISRGIVKEKYREFLAKIKENLTSIEDLRNCIAHNRSVSDKVGENYQLAKDGLERSIEAFWDDIQRKEKEVDSCE
jgi:hypothetical protein